MEGLDEGLLLRSSFVQQREEMYRLAARSKNNTTKQAYQGENMELRHLRYFLALAEELHFARAAERLHIEQSPLSRTIKELEEELNVLLFQRSRRGTQLTWAGQVFLEDVQRIFTVLDQARNNVKAAATGYRGALRIVLSDGIVQPRLASLLALCREEEPDVEIRLFERSLAQQIKGLQSDIFDVGFAHTDNVEKSILVDAVWTDTLVAVIPSRHPLLSFTHVPLDALLRYPLVLCHPDVCEGCSRQIDQILRSVNTEPIVAEHATSLDLMLTLVAAGYGLGFATESQLKVYRHPDVVPRPLDMEMATLTTYLLRPNTEPSEQLERFLQRVSRSDRSPGELTMEED